MIGGLGTDTLEGNEGDDVYVFGDNFGLDTVVELPKEGIDTLDFSRFAGPHLTHVLSENSLYSGETNAPVTVNDNLAGATLSNGQVEYDKVGFGANLVTVDNDQLKNIEKIITSTADNTFLFGDEWGTNWSSALPDAAAYFKNRDRELILDTSNMASAAGKLVLDFRQVTRELQFTFEER